jgi:L-2,4-diaminobutyrate decarboxylase
MALAASLADPVTADPTLALWRRPLTGVVNWRPAEHDAVAVQSRLRDAWVSMGDIGGQRWFRSVAANPCADPMTVVRAVRDAMASLQR